MARGLDLFPRLTELRFHIDEPDPERRCRGKQGVRQHLAPGGPAPVRSGIRGGGFVGQWGTHRTGRGTGAPKRRGSRFSGCATQTYPNTCHCAEDDGAPEEAGRVVVDAVARADGRVVGAGGSLPIRIGAITVSANAREVTPMWSPMLPSLIHAES